MKILWFANTPCGATAKISPESSTGGGWLVSLEHELKKNSNIELYVVFYSSSRIDTFIFNEITYYPVYQPKLRTHFGFTDHDNDIKRLINIVDDVKPDIIHIHGTEKNFGMIQKYTDIPVVLSIQGILSSYREKYYSGIPHIVAFFNEEMKRKIRFVSAGFLFLKMQKDAKVEQKIYSLTKNIMGRTEWDRRVSSVLSPKSQYFVGNEILRSSFYEKQWNKRKYSDTLHIVTTMSSGLYKGLETIVKTAILLNENGIVNFKWTIIGKSENDYLASIIKKWLKIDYNDLHINLPGIKNETEVVDILLNADIYIQASHIENSPNSVCEAMLLGMPVIASFAGGTDSILENRKEGILVQDGDPYSLAGAIKEMSINFDKAFEYGKAARNTALKRHDRQTIVNDLVKTYSKIINDKTK